MNRGAHAAGVKRIRVHDLRHSHVSLLIDMGFTPVAIADRLGHESIEVTLRYAHLFPSKQTEMIEKLEKESSISVKKHTTDRERRKKPVGCVNTRGCVRQIMQDRKVSRLSACSVSR